MGLIKCQDVDVGLDLLSALSNCNSSNVCHTLFSLGYCHLFCSQGQHPTSDNSFRSVGIYTAFGRVEAFHLKNVFSLLPVVHLDKQVSISCLLYIVESSSRCDNLF